jgi:hypothetical protein
MPQWTREDGAECSRLVQEMAADERFQFSLFTFGLTATAVILGVARASGHFETLHIPRELVFLTPLIILVPSSALIVNRARSRNRKAAYMICYLDYKRLLASGVQDHLKLGEVRRRSEVPWETALNILDRSYDVHPLHRRRRVHLARAITWMMGSSMFVEMMCVGLFFASAGGLLDVSKGGRTDYHVGDYIIFASVAVVVAELPLLAVRVYRTLLLEGRDSIQEYVVRWLELRYGPGWASDRHSGRRNDGPLYLAEWIHEWSQQRKPLHMRFPLVISRYVSFPRGGSGSTPKPAP